MTVLHTAEQVGCSGNQEIHYLQSQNGNLYTSRYFEFGADDDPSEFKSLREDVPSEIYWCSEALGMYVFIV